MGTPSLCRFGDGYMITVRTKSSLNVKEVVRFFSRNFPEAILKVTPQQWQCRLCQPMPWWKQPSSPKGPHLAFSYGDVGDLMRCGE